MGHTYIGENTPPIGNHFQHVLWGNLIKATAVRQKVLEVLLENRQDPISIELIIQRAKISKASAYRVVDLFVMNGILNRIKLGGNHYLYEYAIGPTHFHHAVCIKCGLIEDVRICDKGDIQSLARANLKKFATVINHSLEFFGVCRECDKIPEPKRSYFKS